MDPARKRAAYEDLLELPEHVVGEIVDGELYASPRPGSPHAHAGSAIGSDLFGNFSRPPGEGDAPGGWWILDEPELHFGSDVLVPDLAGWRRSRMPELKNVAHFDLAPDWICEIVSPTTGALDRGRKLPAYAREGVAHCWLVDPLARTLEVYRLESGRWVVAATHGGGERVKAEPFEALEVDLNRWWLPE